MGRYYGISNRTRHESISGTSEQAWISTVDVQAQQLVDIVQRAAHMAHWSATDEIVVGSFREHYKVLLVNNEWTVDAHEMDSYKVVDTETLEECSECLRSECAADCHDCHIERINKVLDLPTPISSIVIMSHNYGFDPLLLQRDDLNHIPIWIAMPDSDCFICQNCGYLFDPQQLEERKDDFLAQYYFT